jgi:predicted transposase YdaD
MHQLWAEKTSPIVNRVDKETSDLSIKFRIGSSISDMQVQSNVAASADILARLILKQDFINQVLRKELMQESVIYREIFQEGEDKGVLRGKREEAQSLIIRLLIRRIGNMTPAMQTQVQALSLTQLESLGEALLDFSEPADLITWINEN